MTGEPPSPDPFADRSPARPKRRVSWMAIVVAFLLGVATLAAMLPLIDDWRARRDPAPAAPPADRSAADAVPAAAQVPITIDGLAAREAALDAQVTAIEQRLATADAASRTAAAYATRGEGMLVAFAARRAIDRGLALGYVESQLRARFGATEPAAVATIIAAGKTPVTREELRQALDGIAPKLAGATLRDGFWRSLGRSVSSLIVLRRESTPSPRATDRLDRARRWIDAGNVEAALAEVARMPGAADAGSWIDAAKRYDQARRALDTIERAAIDAPIPTPAPSATQAPDQDPAGMLPGG